MSNSDRYLKKVRETYLKVWNWLTEPVDQFQIARWLFIRILATISFIAFLSFHLQMPGLIGENGIAPAQNYLDSIEENNRLEKYLKIPTIAWIDAGNTALKTISVAGMVLSILLFLNLAPALVSFLLWVLYLSIVTAGQIFMSYQWDLLLLETLFLSIFLAPTHLFTAKPERESPPPRIAVLLIWFLLFKLLFMSGISKLLSGDTSWTGLTALQHHYLTQPLPTPLAWFMDKLPLFFHKLSAVAMFSVELVVPFLFFMPRTIRIKAAYTSIALQILIMATGNYTFFNLLTIALSLMLFDNKHLSWVKEKIGRWIPQTRKKVPKKWKWVLIISSALIIVINIFLFAQIFHANMPRPIEDIQSFTARFKTINSYGLFAVMTKNRPEIVIQGSRDGEKWKTYRFKHKPGDPSSPPPIVAPHQPRLDWQMWFAAYRSPKSSRWFVAFARRLLQGSEDVENLLEYNPFPEKPPKYIRAVRYRYRFTSAETLWKRGRWWKRQREGLYLPPVKLGG